MNLQKDFHPLNLQKFYILLGKKKKKEGKSQKLKLQRQTTEQDVVSPPILKKMKWQK